jgi:hypothetical protein
LGVKEAGSSLHDSDGLVVDGDGVEAVLLIPQHGREEQTQILGMLVRGEGVRDRLLCAGGDLNRVLLRGEVADDARLSGLLYRQRSADEGDANGRRLVVGDRETGFSGMAIDELDTKDLRLRE